MDGNHHHFPPSTGMDGNHHHFHQALVWMVITITFPPSTGMDGKLVQTLCCCCNCCSCAGVAVYTTVLLFTLLVAPLYLSRTSARAQQDDADWTSGRPQQQQQHTQLQGPSQAPRLQ